MSQLFISHSMKDKAHALEMRVRLEGWGYLVFLDSEPEVGIKAGQEWEKELYRRLERAAALVVLSSDNFLA